jgi:hypothetical protein
VTKRLLALVAAVVMIGGAVLIRAQLDESDDGNGNGDSESNGDEQAIIACDPSLAEVCTELDEMDGIDVVVESAADTRTRLEAADARPDTVGISGWLTLDPLPTIVAEQRERAGVPPLLGELAGPLARSPLVLVGWNDRAAALAEACGAPLTWNCIGERAGTPWADNEGESGWGRVEPGIDDIATDATALLIGGQAAASYFDSASFASNDFDQGFRAWWSGLWDAIPSFPATRGTVLDQMLASGPASYDVVGSTEAEAVPTVGGSRESGNVTISYPSPMATADVVLAPIAGAPGADRVGDLADDARLGELLAAASWRVEGEALADGLDPAVEVPATNGLPRAGVLEALRRL